MNPEFHEWTGEVCPCCGMQLIAVRETGFKFCSNDSMICDFEIEPPKLDDRLS